ncbi:MAG: hypothetical protein COA42_04535 [Alteromonadaceae bacterium]|nr:MAG: hypothetical protein COA42_04535 [Alteromonadaceae bacterium]
MKLSFGVKLLLTLTIGSAPTILIAIWWLISKDFSIYLKILLLIILGAWILYFLGFIYSRVAFHIRTFNNLIEAMHTGDYSLRAARAQSNDDLGRLYLQVNRLAASLQGSRVKEQELLSLLGKVLDQIKVAIVVFDYQQRIKLINPQCCQLLDIEEAALSGQHINDTPLKALIGKQDEELLDFHFPGDRFQRPNGTGAYGGNARWQITWQDYREQGQPGQILYITDLQQVLNKEELKAWKNIIRVIAHEVNNSLSPISSLCQTLQDLLSNSEKYPEATEDILPALGVIGERAETLKNFISGYAKVARLPEPQKSAFILNPVLKKTCRMFQEANIICKAPEEALIIDGDCPQIEQLLINLVKNAIEANDGAENKHNSVEIQCVKKGDMCEIQILDQGCGILNKDNLFVPFYTTKSHGTGVGLMLCRQIAASHMGSVTLDNRATGEGAVATILLPLAN